MFIPPSENWHQQLIIGLWLDMQHLSEQLTAGKQTCITCDQLQPLSFPEYTWPADQPETGALVKLIVYTKHQH